MCAQASSLLIIATLLGGEGPTGVETHLHSIRKEARERGHEVRLVTPYTGSRWSRAIYRPLKNARGEFARVLYRKLQARTVAIQLRSILRQNPGRPVTIYAQCPLSARAALAARRTSPASIAAAVHYNISEADEVVARGWARPGGPWAEHLRQLEAEALPRVDRIAFVSDFMRRLVNERVPAITHVAQSTLANFADDPGPTRGPAGPAGDLIAIGTLEARKNQSFLLQVLAECRGLGRNYSLTIAGDGPDFRALQALAGKLQLAQQVHFLGFQRNAAALIPGHRVLVHAAKSENCPLIIAEALACGRPIMAPAVGGIPEMFTDQVEGHYWDLEQPREAAESLIRLLEDPIRYLRASTAARQRYDAAFSNLRGRWMNFLLPV